MATAYALGCNIRCVFCWANETRDNLELAKDFYRPEEVFHKLSEIIVHNPKIDKMRISNGETTIGREHLLQFAELFEKSPYNKFVIETNGVLLGHDKSYAKELSQFKKSYIRVSLRAATAEDWSRKTGAIQETFMLPFQAIRHLREYKANYTVSAMSADPRFMTPLERISLITRLGEIDPKLVLKLEEEVAYLFPVAQRLMKKHGWNIYHNNLPFFLRGPIQKYLQISYEPLFNIGKRKVSIRRTLRNMIQLRHGI
ncbi:MAG: radical SAM protein [Bacteroidota bacterium]